MLLRHQRIIGYQEIQIIIGTKKAKTQRRRKKAKAG